MTCFPDGDLPSQRSNVQASQRPTRVVHVLFSFDTGGLEKGIATVVTHGSPEFEHVIVCLTRSGASARLLPLGTQIVELGKPAGNSPVFLWRLSRALRRLGPDVVHTRNWSGMDGILAARLAGIRSVVHGEHGWGLDDPEGLNPKRLRIRRFLSGWVRQLTCVSKAIEEWLVERVGIRRPVTQIYNGVDTERYSPGDGSAVRASLGISPEAFVVGAVGRLDPIKDHGTLFRAFETLRGERRESVLLVCGDGPERERLEASAGPGIRLLGNREDVPELMRAFDVFTLSSLNEGISNTVLEAMATGLPVVATRVGGNPELIQDGSTGCLVAPGDPARLAAVLGQLAADPLLRSEQGDAARRRVLDRFSIGSMVCGYEGAWRRTAKRSRRGTGR